MEKLDRRSLLGIATASLAAPVAALAAPTDPGPDAALLRLGEEWRRAQAAEAEACAAFGLADARFHAMAPERPACLLVRGSDITNDLAPATHRVFTPDTLPGIKRVHAQRRAEAESPWHRAVIDRCAELLAAIPAYYGATDAALEASGYNAEDARHAATTRLTRSLEERLADHPARTLPGIRLKAQLALSVADPDDTYESRIFLAVFRQLAELPA